MKTVCKKLLCLMLVAMMLVSAVPAAFAEGAYTFWIELHVDGVHVDSKPMPAPVADGTNMDEAAVKNAAKTLYPTYFGAGYVYDHVEETKVVSADNQGARIFVTTAPACTHANKNETVTKQATCVENGSKTITCADCGESLSTESIPNLGGHTLAGDKCMNRFADGTKCDYVRQPVGPKGKLIVNIYTKTDDTNYVSNGVAKTLSGQSTYTLNDSLATQIIGKQLANVSWKDSNTGKSLSSVDVSEADVEVNLYATIVVTENNKKVYQLEVIHNNSTSDRTYIDIYEGEGILAAIANAGLSKKLKDMGKVIDGVEYVLVGFSVKHTGNSATSLNIHHTATADLADSSGNIEIYADWEKKTDDGDPGYEFPDGNGGLYGDANEDPIYDAVLYIYTNGKTSSYAKKVTSSDLGAYTKDGKLTRGEVEIIVNKYFKVASNATYNGLFTTETWNKGNYLNMNAKYEMALDPDKTTAVYVMVNPATIYVADSTNPKTGDMITIAVTGMALSAAALVSMIELKKRKMI